MMLGKCFDYKRKRYIDLPTLFMKGDIYGDYETTHLKGAGTITTSLIAEKKIKLQDFSLGIDCNRMNIFLQLKMFTEIEKLVKWLSQR